MLCTSQSRVCGPHYTTLVPVNKIFRFHPSLPAIPDRGNCGKWNMIRLSSNLPSQVGFASLLEPQFFAPRSHPWESLCGGRYVPHSRLSPTGAPFRSRGISLLALHTFLAAASSSSSSSSSWQARVLGEGWVTHRPYPLLVGGASPLNQSPDRGGGEGGK